MSRLKLFLIVTTIVASLDCGASVADRESGIALRAPLLPAIGARQSWSFTVKSPGLHDVSLEFPWPVEVKAVSDVIERAGGTGPVPAEFDFSWQVVQGEKELAAGSGDQGVKGVSDSSDSGGGGSRKSRALVFGSFSAEPGVTCTIRWVSQSAFEPMLRARPVLLIEPNHPVVRGVSGFIDRGQTVTAQFVYDAAPFPSAHASTIAEMRDGLVAAWFGGTREGAPDVGIWVSRHTGGKWAPPMEVATGVQPDGTRHPCWNPVLFDVPGKGLMLFYKVGPNPRSWWGMVRMSHDSGRTWSAARRLPDGILGPIKNKPVRLGDGTLISPSSTESPERPSRWRVHFELSRDAGETWTIVRPPDGQGAPQIDAIQPSILIHAGGRIQAVGRTRSGRVFETWSSDNGRTWTPLALTNLPNPNAGTDAVTLRDGRHLLVYNHTTEGRSPLNGAISNDGKTGGPWLVLESEPGEYSYPAAIQTADGLVHVTYTWKRERIKHVVVDPAREQS
jgi:predicted neuraminidase